MQFITVTRPDGSKIELNVGNFISVADAPLQNSPLAGPANARTRIRFVNQTHQDVIETRQAVMDLITISAKNGGWG